MAEISGIALKAVTGLAKPLIALGLKKLKKLKPIQRFRIEQAIESAFAEVWDALDSYFTTEKLDETRRNLIAEACARELRPYAEDVELLLGGSLDGEKLFENLRTTEPFPQEIQDEKLEQVYRMVFPLVASILCKAPVIVEQVDEKELHEILARFDALKEQVSTVIAGIAQVQHEPQRHADELFNRVLQQALKKVLLGVEVTGLYGDSPLKQAKEEMFVLPAIVEVLTEDEQKRHKRNAKDASAPENHRDFFLPKSGRVIVRGAPGAGKSTWSRWLQVQALRDRRLLALHVRLRSCSGRQLPTISDIVSELVGRNMAKEIDTPALARWVKNGQVALILDGFDEVAPAERDAVLSQIKEIADYVQKGACILTSRPLNTDHLEQLHGVWTPWFMQPFSKPRILDYIRRWYRHAPLKEGASRDVNDTALYDALTRDPHVAPLTTNPLMLATLLMVHHNDGELPKGRSKLYARYIDGMLGLWDDRQEVHADMSGLDREKKKRVLTNLAITLHLSNEDELNEPVAVRLIKSALKQYGYKADARIVLDSLRERSGLIEGPGSYSFTHKSIGEYLVAQAICDGDRIIDGEKLDRLQLHSQRGNDRWLNVLYFWAGSAPVGDIQSFIETLNLDTDLGLVFGLLWDQMDRFQQTWFEDQVRRALVLWDQGASKTGSREFHYFGWMFADKPKKNIQESLIGVSMPLRHIAVSNISADETLGELLVRARIGQKDLDMLKNSRVYNGCVNLLTHGIVKMRRAQFLAASTTHWPLWLKKSQCACLYLGALREQRQFDEVVPEWDNLFSGDADGALPWLTAAVVVTSRIGRSNDRESKRVPFLTQLLQLSWDDHQLSLTKQWFQVNGVSEAQTGDLFEAVEKLLSGSSNLSETEQKATLARLVELKSQRDKAGTTGR